MPRVARVAAAFLVAGSTFVLKPTFKYKHPHLSFISQAFAFLPVDDPFDVSKLRDKIEEIKPLSSFKGLKTIHDLFRFGGKLGLVKSEGKARKPKTASELVDSKEADCSDTTYGIIGTITSLKRDHIIVGAIFGKLKDGPKDITHIVPFALLKGSHPVNNQKYVALSMQAFKLSGEWSFIFLDPQAEFGTMQGEFAQVRFQKATEVKGNYYREMGHHELRSFGITPSTISDVETNAGKIDLESPSFSFAFDCYKEAVNLNSNDAEAKNGLLFLTGVRLQKFSSTFGELISRADADAVAKQNLKHMVPVMIEDTRTLLEYDNDPINRAALEANLSKLLEVNARIQR